MPLTGRLRRLTMRVTPLGLRKSLALLVGNRPCGPRRRWLSVALLQDWAERNPAEYHSFVWGHHLESAQEYESKRDFGADKLLPIRHLLFSELRAELGRLEIAPERDIRSVLEVGCANGYLLRYAETHVFTAASELVGFDVDRKAIERGSRYLAAHGSRVRLLEGNMKQLEAHFGDRQFDIILCAGVLMYLPQDEADEVVNWMARHTKELLVLAGSADRTRDNSALEQSTKRRDHTVVHNFDRMAMKAGARVSYRRWDGARTVNGQTVYFVFCLPTGTAVHTRAAAGD